MLIDIVAVLEENVPTLLNPTALTVELEGDLTLNVIWEFRGIFKQCTSMETGFDCCAERKASGVAIAPVGVAETGTPPMLVMINCAPASPAGNITG
jgi:hypothetical protein